MLFFFRSIFNLPYKTKLIIQRLEIIEKRNRLKDISQ